MMTLKEIAQKACDEALKEDPRPRASGPELPARGSSNRVSPSSQLGLWQKPRSKAPGLAISIPVGSCRIITLLLPVPGYSSRMRGPTSTASRIRF